MHVSRLFLFLCAAALGVAVGLGSFAAVIVAGVLLVLAALSDALGFTIEYEPEED